MRRYERVSREERKGLLALTFLRVIKKHILWHQARELLRGWRACFLCSLGRMSVAEDACFERNSISDLCVTLICEDVFTNSIKTELELGKQQKINLCIYLPCRRMSVKRIIARESFYSFIVEKGAVSGYKKTGVTLSCTCVEGIKDAARITQ